MYDIRLPIAIFIQHRQDAQVILDAHIPVDDQITNKKKHACLNTHKLIFIDFTT